MENIFGKIRLVEWDRYARAGKVAEPSDINAIHPNNILCPVVIGPKREVCGGDLWDLPLEITQYKGRSKRAVECEKCGWWGSREISTKGSSTGVKEKISCSEWNRIRAEHHEYLVKKYDEKVVIVCDMCGNPLEDTSHRDFSGPVVKVQVICTNAKCNFGSGYRLE